MKDLIVEYIAKSNLFYEKQVKSLKNLARKVHLVKFFQAIERQTKKYVKKWESLLI